MHPDHAIEVGELRVQRLEPLLVERVAVDVGVELHAQGPERPAHVFDLLDGAVWIVHRQACDEAREPVRVTVDELGQALVAEPCEVARHGGGAEVLDRGGGQADDLAIVVAELLQLTEPQIEVEHRRYSGDPLAHVRGGGHVAKRGEPIRVLLRHHVAEGIELHLRESPVTIGPGRRPRYTSFARPAAHRSATV